MTHPLDVIGYTRVSTQEQARDGYGLDAQEKKIRAYCELYDLKLVRIISDPGLSGKDLDRPGMQEVLTILRQRKDTVHGLVVAKLDRLTRCIEDFAGLIREFFKNEGRKKLFSVEESIDTRRAAGRLVLNIIMMVAEWEREVIGERTSDALQAKIAMSERCGKIRFGYDLDDDGVHLVPNTHEQEVIAQLREWKAQGKTYREMVEMVHELGIETKEGSRIWQPATIRRIILRPA